MFSEFDRLAMTRALALAERGLETTHPNPRVGCVIAQGDRIIGEGFHERAGEPHAEVMALRSAKEPVAGATAYVTLEPCSHHGRTPPCVNALIEARVARVVFAVQDPNPRVSGQGADALLRAGITVEAGLLQNEATELNIGFMKRMREGLPWVRVKLAMSLDGRTALANGASQWITGEAARADVQRWRARCSAVMTGVGTLLADDPQLNVRLPAFKGRQPLRVVLDAQLRSPVGAKLFGGGAAGSAVGKAAVGDVGGAAGMAAAGADVGAAAKAVAGSAVAKATAGGDVVIFTAADGGVATVAGGTVRAPVLAGPSALEGDMAALVNAFETSPTSVAARTDSVSAPAASVKSDPRPAAPAKAASAAVTAGVPASASVQVTPVTPLTAVPGTVMDLYPASGNDKPAATVAAGVEPTSPAAAGGANWSVRTAAAAEVEASKVSPPVVAAAADAAGVAPTADDATWAGAALSGAIAVKPEADPSGTSTAGPNGATPPAAGAPLANPAVPLGPEAVLQSRAALLATATIGDTVLISNPTAPAASKVPVATAAASNGAAVPPASAASKPPITSVPPAAHKVAATSAPPAVPHVAAVATAADAAPPKPAAQADTPAAFKARRGALAAKGVRIEEVPSDDGFLDLFAVLKKLGEMEVNEVLVEAGPTLAGQLLTTFFVDELLLYVAPKLLGPQGRPLVNLPELQSLQDAWGFSLFDAKRFGDDLRLRMRPK